MNIRDIAECEMAHAWIQGDQGDEGGDLFGNASGNLHKALAEYSYQMMVPMACLRWNITRERLFKTKAW
jgi:hypothetical protein